MRSVLKASWLSRVVILSVAVPWCWAAVAKSLSLLAAAQVTTEPSWNDAVGVKVALATVEGWVAWLLASGVERRGLVIGLGLLAAYSVFLAFYPGEVGCGCGLDVGSHPLSRNAALSALHVLALALTPGGRRGVEHDGSA